MSVYGPARLLGTGAAGKAGVLTAALAVRESMTMAGRAERARAVRAFVGAVLGPGHPCRDDAALLVSELFGNSVRRSRSGAAGRMVTVTVRAGGGVVRVEVTDRGGRGCRGCGRLAAMRKTAGGFIWWRASRRSGGGDSVAAGR